MSPDGKIIVAADRDGNFCSWSLPNGRFLWQIKATQRIRGSVANPAFSQDGKLLALTCQDGEISLHDAWTSEALRKLRIGFFVKFVTFCHKGTFLAVAGNAGQVQLWDHEKAKLIHEWQTTSSPLGVCFTREGKGLVIIYPEKNDRRKLRISRIDVHSIESIQKDPVITTTEVRYNTSQTVLSPSGKYLSCVNAERTSIVLLDPDTGEEKLRIDTKKCQPEHIALSSDEALIACSDSAGMIEVWSTSSRALLFEVRIPSADARHLALSADGRYFAFSCWSDQDIRVWNIQARKELTKYPGHRVGPLSVSFVKGCKTLATMSGPTDGSLFHKWDVPSGDEVANIPRAIPTEVYRYCSFSADGSLAAHVTHGGLLHLWDIVHEKNVRSWVLPTSSQTIITGSVRQERSVLNVSEPVFSYDGKVLFASKDSVIWRWQTESGVQMPSFHLPSDCLNTRCFVSPHGKRLLVACQGVGPGTGYLCVLETETGKLLHKLATPIAVALPLPISPDEHLAAVNTGREIMLWNITGGFLVTSISDRMQHPVALAYSPDGRLLAVGGSEKEAFRLWHLHTRHFIGGLKLPNARVHSLSFSPDGQSIALSCDNTAMICKTKQLLDEKVETVGALSNAQAQRLWKEIKESVGPTAYEAMRRLETADAKTIRLLMANYRTLPQVDDEKVASLIDKLDDDDFRTREAASNELARLGADIAPELYTALNGSTSPEKRARLAKVLKSIGGADSARVSGHLIGLRVIEILESQGSVEARAALKELAYGKFSKSLKQEAKAALSRLKLGNTNPD